MSYAGLADDVSARVACKPSFLGLGAGKAGTSWLWEMLRCHADVFLPSEKELHYFNELSFEGENVRNPRADRPLEWYLGFFRDAAPHQVCGEISPSYLWNPSAPARIRAFEPSMRLFAALRDPVDRIFSAYLFGVQRGELPSGRSFEQTLEDRPYLVERTMYGVHVSRYLDVFPADQLHVVLHEEIRNRPEAVLRDLERFIGVEPYVPPDVREASNVTEQPVNPRATRRLKQMSLVARHSRLEPLVGVAERLGARRVYDHLRRTKPFDARPEVAPATADRLRAFFTDDIERLEKLLGLDLGHWKADTA